MTLLFTAMLMMPAAAQESPTRGPAPGVRSYEEREAANPGIAEFAGGEKWSGADIQLVVWLVAGILTLIGAILELLFGWF